jgi:hypothetical protein
MTEAEQQAKALRTANEIVTEDDGDETGQEFTWTEYAMVARALLNASSQRDAMAEALRLAVDALEEAEAILGGEYGDHYAVLCNRMSDLRATLTLSPPPKKATRKKK